MTIGHLGLTIFRTGGGAAAAYPAPLLTDGQITAYSHFDSGAYELGVAKAYTVVATAGTSDIQVAHYAAATLSFTAPNTIADAAGGLAEWAVNDRMVIKGSGSNDGEVLVTNVGGAPNSLTIAAAVNELAGAVISLYKTAALSNNVVQDDNTGRMWARYTSNGLKVGINSNGNLNWYDVATRFTLYGVANTISVVMPGNILRITGGAALTQFHAGDMIMPAGFANGVNNAANLYVVSAAPNVADLDIVVDSGPETLVAEGAVGDTIYLNTRSIYNFCAGANLAGAGGYSDWRQPNQTEAESLKDMEAPTSYPEAVAFPTWPTHIWHSTSYDYAPTQYAQQGRYDRNVVNAALKSAVQYCALVRN